MTGPNAIPDFTSLRGVVASRAARDHALHALDHLAERLAEGSGSPWRQAGPDVFERDGMRIDARPHAWHPPTVILHGGCTASVQHASIAPGETPAECAGRIIRTIGAALAAARHANAGTWRVPTAFMQELRELAGEVDDAAYARVTHPSPLHPGSIRITGGRRMTRRDVEALLDAVPPRACRIVARSRAGRGGSATHLGHGIELLAPESFIPLPPLDPIARLRMEAERARRGR